MELNNIVKLFRNFESVQSNNIIFINGGTTAEVKKALKQWIKDYDKVLKGDCKFQLYQQAGDKHVIVINFNIDNKLFYFLLNDLTFPKNIDYKVEVIGYTVGRDFLRYRGKQLMVTISVFHDAYDEAFVTTEDNQHYRVSMTGKISSIEASRSFIPLQKPRLNNPIVLKPGKKRNLDIEDKSEEVLTKNNQMLFYIISTLFIVIFFSGIVSIPMKQKAHDEFLTFFGTGLFVWFYLDFRMLRSTTNYTLCLMMGALFLLFRLFENSLSPTFEIGTVFRSAALPIVFLLLQWPMRKLYLNAMKKEPKTMRRDISVSVSEIIYSFTLLISTILSVYLLSEIRFHT